MKMYRVLPRFLILSLAIVAAACGNDPVEVPRGPFEQGVLIMNEGAFGANDGEVFHYDPQSGDTRTDIFEEVNGRPFAGLIQDMLLFEDRIYLVANTGKVEVVDAQSFQSVGSVNNGDLDISRSLVRVGQKLFISDFGPYDDNFASPDSYVAVVRDPQGGTVAQKIPVSSAPEGMIIANGHLFVACTAGGVVEVIDPEAETLMESIPIEGGSPYFFLEYAGNTYLYARDSESVYFHRINTQDFQVIESIAIPLANSLWNGSHALGSGGEVFILTSSGGGTSVAKVSLEEGTVLDESFYTGTNFYGLGYHSGAGHLYVGENAAWQGNGTVIKLDPNGEVVETLTAGRGPSGFLFR